MIQRIQSVYLFLIVVLSGITIFSPLADLINKADNLIYLVDFNGITLIKPTGNIVESTIWGLIIITALVLIIALLTIFNYKNRIKQIRLTVVNMFFLISFYAFLLLYLWPACVRLHTDWHLRLTAILPLVNLILSYLAIGSIGKDEKLVKSLDRLR